MRKIKGNQRSGWILLLDRIQTRVCYLYPAYARYRDAVHRSKALNGGYKGSRQEYRAVRDYWKKYHKHPNMMWFRMFSDGADHLDPRYIPTSMWYTDFLPYYNNVIMGRAYVDKCAYDLIYPDLKKPATIIKNVAGHYYGPGQELLTEEQALSACLAHDGFIAKCATDSYGGRGIAVFHKDEITKDAVRALFERFGKNFIVQELVDQHPDLKAVNPSSLNTLRIISFFFKDEVHILSAQLRVGGPGARVDNYSSGGFACNVRMDGRLSERAVSKDGWSTVHPNGTRFCDIVVPGFDKVLETIRKEHRRLPYLGIIGWDFGIDADGDPVFIEINESSQDNQIGSGPTFGDMTEEVLQDIYIDKKNRNALF